MANRASPRILWAVDALGIAPDDRVLEIGCGQGVAVSLICERLDGGNITAIDRSAKMTALARKRNAACIDAGLATVITADFPGPELDGLRFDAIFAVHVGIFWQRPAVALAAVRDLLAPGGEFSLLFQPLQPARVTSLMELAAKQLVENGFTVSRSFSEEIPGGPMARVAAMAD